MTVYTVEAFWFKDRSSCSEGSLRGRVCACMIVARILTVNWVSSTCIEYSDYTDDTGS